MRPVIGMLIGIAAIRRVPVELVAHDAQLFDHRLAIGEDAFRPFEHPPAFLGEPWNRR